MSKGLKMESAKNLKAGGSVLNVGQLSKSDNGNLKCVGCIAEVMYVSSHMRGASKIPVSAYLKLWGNECHSENCRYSVRGAVEQLVADSNAIEDISPIFELQEDGSYLFRINILVEALKVVQDLSTATDNGDVPERQFYGRTYVHTDQHLASYFRSASGITKLRALIQDSSDVELLKKLVKIQYKDSFISWNDFYYDETRYHVLFNRLKINRLHNPVALNVTVKSDVKVYEGAKNFKWSFSCYSEITHVDEKKKIIIPTLQLADEKLVSKITSGETYLVVGEVWTKKVKDEQSIYQNFNVGVWTQSQFKREIEE